ncbi:MAG: NAD(P)H-hydrate dehydratase [Candidatus Bathyarchaeota archaeon]|nr:NAD(P)H-hydrate dehydratase [Candidatus Bathyarchaeota archaeon]
MPLETITSQQMRALETNAEYYGITLLQLMENAGQNLAKEISTRFGKNQKVTMFCGLGGNGGDGFVAARHLLSMGFTNIQVFIAGKGKNISHSATLQNYQALQTLNSLIQITEITDSTTIPPIQADVVVDALLGTGTKGKLKAPIAQIVACINAAQACKIAVDVPTGVDSDTGEVLGEAVKADFTVTFHRAKQGLQAAQKYAGEVVVCNIGLPEVLSEFAGPGEVLLAVKKRGKTAHKGDSGRLLVIGGSETFSGAPALASLAALRTGVDIVYTAVPQTTGHDVAALSPDLITLKLEGENLRVENVVALKSYIAEANAVVLGPGAGQTDETKEFMKACIAEVEAAGKPLLLDADGLKAFAEFKRALKVPLVLTPHAGEFAILTGKQLPPNVKERIAEVKRAAAELGAVVLLKGKTDVISDGVRVKMNFSGNPAMTVGGTGDVLSGVVGALLAQGVAAFLAASAGAFVNGAAGDFAASEMGCHLCASDLLDYLAQALDDPMSHLKVQQNSAKSP